MQTSVGLHFLESAFSIILDSLFADPMFIHDFLKANLWHTPLVLLDPLSEHRTLWSCTILTNLGESFAGTWGFIPSGCYIEIWFSICILNVHHHRHQPMFPPICAWDSFTATLPALMMNWKQIQTHTHTHRLGLMIFLLVVSLSFQGRGDHLKESHSQINPSDFHSPGNHLGRRTWWVCKKKVWNIVLFC